MVSTGGQYASPQVAWTGPVNGTSYDVITAANQADGLDCWWVHDDSGLNWNAEAVAANGTQAVYANPGIAVNSNSVVITAINTRSGDVMYWSQPFGTNSWNEELVTTGRVSVCFQDSAAARLAVSGSWLR